MQKTTQIIQFLVITFSIFFLFQNHVSAQQQRRGPNQSLGKIKGTIQDEQSGKAMEYVTIALYSLKNNDLVKGVISDVKGNFIINDLAYGTYRLEVNFMGYSSHTIDKIILKPRQSSFNTGKIIMVTDQKLLSTVEVIGRTDYVKYELDKKVIDVSKMSTVASETAIELLETIPSISIDIDGGIALRGSQNFKLLIDGQPTSLSASDVLSSIPASSIQNIEIITNPSAKYDAEGTGGLINIVLKKNTLQGITAIINTSIGNFDNYSADGQIQYNKNKLSLQLGAKYRDMHGPATLHSIRRTERNGIKSEVEGLGDFDRLHGVRDINLVVGYKFNNNHQIHIDANVMKFKMNTSLDLDFTEKINDQIVLQSKTIENTIRDFGRSKWGVNYEYFIGGDQKHFIQAKLFQSLFDGDELATTHFTKVGESDPHDGKQSSEVGPSNLTRYNLDYSKTFEGGSRIELGGQAQYGRSEDINKSLDYEPSSKSFEPIDSLDTHAVYYRDIFALYSTFGSSIKQFKYQIGLRAEKTIRNVEVNESLTKTVIDRWDFFPSAHTSYELNKKTKLFANYSRRINRPRSYWLEPFFSWRDAYNIRQGNPDLLPEYIDSYEMGLLRDLPKGHFSAEIYHRTTNNLITRIKSVYTQNTFLTRPENVGKEFSTGIETSIGYRFFKIWNSNLSMNIFNYRIEGSFNTIGLNDESNSWTLRWDNKFKIGKGWKFQLTSMYDSPIVRPQGKRSETYSVNTSIKKAFWDSKLIVNLQVRDVLNTQIRESYEEGTNFYYYNQRDPKAPKVSLALSFKINNYKEKRMKTQDSDQF